MPPSKKGSGSGLIDQVFLEELLAEADLKAFIERQEGLVFKREGVNWTCNCPLHDENSASFKIKDGARWFKCFGCLKKGNIFKFCTDAYQDTFPEAVKRVASFLGKPMPDGRGDTISPKPVRKIVRQKFESIKDPNAQPKEKISIGGRKRIEKIYSYYRSEPTHTAGDAEPDPANIAHQTIRFEGKGFAQRRKLTDLEKEQIRALHEGGLAQDEISTRTEIHAKAIDALLSGKDQNPWSWKLKVEETILYNLWLIRSAPEDEPIFFCEGEKDADNVTALGLRGTTAPMGSHQWADHYAAALRGKWVVVVEDYDAQPDGKGKGAMCATRLAQTLLPIASRISYLSLPDFWPGHDPERKLDISDWLSFVTSETGFTGDFLRDKLLEIVDIHGTPPPHVLYADIFHVGERGGIHLEQLKLAGRIVRYQNLLHCASRWWQFRNRGQHNAGMWVQFDDDIPVRRMIAEAIDLYLSHEVDSRTVNSVMKLAETIHHCNPSELNQLDTNVVNCRNGMLNARTGELTAHDPTYYSTTQLPHRWNPGTECPEWIKWLTEMQPNKEVRLQLQEIFGYCMVPGVNYHKFFMMYGDGGTGKSTCVDVLCWLVGEMNRVSVRLEELDQPFMRHSLVGRQIYLCKELKHSSFRHIDLIKAITSGDPINVDVKYGEPFSFVPQGRFVMESNVLAMTPDASEGFGRRFLQIDWLNKLEEGEYDFTLKERFLPEMEGIFCWAIEGFQRLYARGAFEHTEASRRAYDDLMKNRNQVGVFLQDEAWVVDHWTKIFRENDVNYAMFQTSTPETTRIIAEMKDQCEENNWWVSADDLYLHYLAWCQDNTVLPWIPIVGKVDEVSIKAAATKFMREVYTKNQLWKHIRRFRRRTTRTVEEYDKASGVTKDFEIVEQARFLYGIQLVADTANIRRALFS